MYTYYTITASLHQDAGEFNLASKFPYHLFKGSWYHYLSILDIDYGNSFRCPNCTIDGNPPNVCDATSLAFRRDLRLNNNTVPSRKGPIGGAPYIGGVGLHREISL